MGIFNWIVRFEKSLEGEYESTDPLSLIHFVEQFKWNLFEIAEECYKKPINSYLLKELMVEECELLTKYKNDKKPKEMTDPEKRLYLKRMTNILAVWVNLELLISKLQLESELEISNKIFLYLNVYLEKSLSHVIDTMIQIEFIEPQYYPILSKLFGMIFENIPRYPITDQEFARYFLAYKLYLDVNDEENHPQKDLMKQAVKSLTSYFEDIPPFFYHFVLSPALMSDKVENHYSIKDYLANCDTKAACDAFLINCIQEPEVMVSSSYETEKKYIDMVLRDENFNVLKSKINEINVQDLPSASTSMSDDSQWSGDLLEQFDLNLDKGEKEEDNEEAETMEGTEMPVNYFNEEIIDETKIEEIAQEIKIGAVAEEVETEEVAQEIEIGAVAEEVETEEVAEEIEIQEVTEEVETEEVAEKIEIEGVAELIAEEIEIEGVAELIAEEVKTEEEAEEIEIEGVAELIAEEVEIEGLAELIAEEIQIDEIIEEIQEIFEEIQEIIEETESESVERKSPSSLIPVDLVVDKNLNDDNEKLTNLDDSNLYEIDDRTTEISNEDSKINFETPDSKEACNHIYEKTKNLKYSNLDEICNRIDKEMINLETKDLNIIYNHIDQEIIKKATQLLNELRNCDEDYKIIVKIIENRLKEALISKAPKCKTHKIVTVLIVYYPTFLNKMDTLHLIEANKGMSKKRQLNDASVHQISKKPKYGQINDNDYLQLNLQEDTFDCANNNFVLENILEFYSKLKSPKKGWLLKWMFFPNEEKIEVNNQNDVVSTNKEQLIEPKNEPVKIELKNEAVKIDSENLPSFNDNKLYNEENKCTFADLNKHLPLKKRLKLINEAVNLESESLSSLQDNKLHNKDSNNNYIFVDYNKHLPLKKRLESRNEAVKTESENLPSLNDDKFNNEESTNKYRFVDINKHLPLKKRLKQYGNINGIDYVIFAEWDKHLPLKKRLMSYVLDHTKYLPKNSTITVKTKSKKGKRKSKKEKSKCKKGKRKHKKEDERKEVKKPKIKVKKFVLSPDNELIESIKKTMVVKRRRSIRLEEIAEHQKNGFDCKHCLGCKNYTITNVSNDC